MKNREAKNILINKEGCKCLLTGYTVKREELTFHHISKKEWGGTATPDNGANLLGKIHEWLHNSIEYNDKELFILINECLLNYKEVMRLNNEELLKEFEEECQPLFQEEYNKYLIDHPVKTKVKKKKRRKR